MQIIQQGQNIQIKHADASGRIITESVAPDAVAVLRWYWANIPANA